MNIRINLLLFILKGKNRDSVTFMRDIGQGLNLHDLLIFKMIIRAPVSIVLIVSYRVLLIRNLKAIFAPDSGVKSSKGPKD